MTSAPTSSPVSVTDNPAEHRYEAHVDGALAGFCVYRVQAQAMTLVHTEVLPAFEGGGVGSALARFALDDARRRQLAVVPACSFIAAYIDRHPAYSDLVR